MLGNTLARRPSQLVGFCFGMLGAFWLLVAVVVALVAAAHYGNRETAATVAVVGGSALLLGWAVVPLLIAGADATVDSRHLVAFPLTTRQIMLALSGTGLTGIPGIVTALASLATVVLWVRWPLAAVTAVPAIALAVVTCVVASRLIATLSVGIGSHRRGREIIGSIVLGLVIMIGPIVTGFLALLDAAGDVPARFAQAGVLLSWTPLGAAWAVPGDVAAGAWLPALAKAVIAAATLAVLWLVWVRALEASVSAPPRQTSRALKPGTLGLFGVLPTGGIGATWARSLTAWLRDPRYLRQLILVPLFPALFAFFGGIDGWLFGLSALLIAFILAIVGYADISYDGTAFASVISSGLRGRADRWGRVLGAASVGVPAVVAVALTTTAIAGSWSRLPAVLGAALGLLLVGYGVSAVTSALIVVPVPAAGDSPFKSVPGQTFVNGLIVFAVMGACAVLAAPALVSAIISLVTASAVLGGVSLAAGVGVGVGVIVAGVAIGGRTLERTAPDLLMRIKAFPT